MTLRKSIITITVLFICFPLFALSSGQSNPSMLSGLTLVNAVAKNTGEIYIVPASFDVRVHAFGLNIEKMNKQSLASLLGQHNYSIINKNQTNYIVSLKQRKRNAPNLDDLDPQALSPYDVISKTITLEHVYASTMIPAIRSLLSTHAHVSGIGKKIILVGFNTNIQKASKLIDDLDVKGKAKARTKKKS